eukprot:TRINITY_DN6693_c0_g1_i2.p1 TRINITY_DN6693_c0_g1~~TRINITY_DN6693_c0_g1_i2.p1  ORF type:complete len:373 (+),score=38.76 TRINITY_DN6693_c0_g1_i2:54-1172(+)
MNPRDDASFWDGSRPPDEVAQVTGVTAATIDNTSFHSMEEWKDDDDELVVPEKPLDLGKKFCLGFKGKKRMAPYQYKSGLLTSWNLNDTVRTKLEEGYALFGFSCKVGSQLSPEEKRIFSLGINLTDFNDETTENAVQHIDMNNLEASQASDATFFLTRALYLLPRIELDTISLDSFITPEYHRACQVSTTKVWDDCVERGDPTTFRITKTLIPWVFKMTVQFRCSLIPEDQLSKLNPLLNGLQVHKAILMERTKRDKTSIDMTKKCKSILLFHELPENRGLLCANPSFIVNSSIPKFLAVIMDKVGSMGAAEVAETATKSRLWWARQASPNGKAKPVEVPASPLCSPRSYRIRAPGCTDSSKYAKRTMVPA